MKFNKRAQFIKESPINWLIQYALENPSTISLAAGLVEEDSLPVDELKLAFDSLIESGDARKFLQYGTTAGLSPLKKEISRWLVEIESTTYKPLDIDPETMVITNGSQQFLYLLSEALLEEGDIVLIESPSYFVYADTLSSMGVDFQIIKTDEEGIRVDDLKAQVDQLRNKGELERVKMLYMIPWCQNPSGVSRSKSRELELSNYLIQLTSEMDQIGLYLSIVEDAAYRSLCFEPMNVSSTMLQHAELVPNIAYVTTFSKPFAPGLKLGAGLLPPELLKQVLLIKGSHDFGTSHWNQALLWKLLENKWLDKARMRVLNSYKSKAKLLHQKLKSELPQGFDVSMPSGGMYMWVKAPSDFYTHRSSEFFQSCLDHGVLYVPGEYCDLDPVHSLNTIRLSYGRVSEEQILEGADRLIGVINTKISLD